MQVIQHWRQVLRAESIIPATTNHDCIGNRQVAHLMAEAGARWLPSWSDINEFSCDYFAVNCGGLEITQFRVVELIALFEFATKIVNTFEHLVALKEINKL